MIVASRSAALFDLDLRHRSSPYDCPFLTFAIALVKSNSRNEKMDPRPHHR